MPPMLDHASESSDDEIEADENEAELGESENSGLPEDSRLAMMLRGEQYSQGLFVPHGEDDRGDTYEGEPQESNDGHHQVQVSRDEANKSTRSKSPIRVPQPSTKPDQENLDQANEEDVGEGSGYPHDDDSSSKDDTISQDKGQQAGEDPQQTRPKARRGRRTKQQMIEAAGLTEKRRSARRLSRQDYFPKRRKESSIKRASKPGPAGKGSTRKAGRPPGQGQEWEIESIVGSRIDVDTHEHFYEVKWRGYSSKENTWEPKRHLGNCRAAIADFEKRIKQN